MNPPTQQAKIETVIVHSPRARTLRLGWSLDFRPGQAVQIQLPGDEKKRYYSISSSPVDAGYVDITIQAEAGTPLAQQLDELKEGMTVQVAGPFGAFSLPAHLKEPLCFIAAGSGITPLRSMVRWLADTEISTDVWIFHSAPTKADLLFHDQFIALAQQHPRVHYTPTLTRGHDTGWSFETGRITDVMMRKHIQPEKSCFLLCGPPAFVTDMEHLLKAMSVPTDRIRREQW